MKTAEPEVIERSVQKTRQWIEEVAHELGDDDHRRAYRVLRSVLHTLRDRVTVNEAAQLAAQLPELLRGAYNEGWVPARTPLTYRRRDEFLVRVAEGAGLAGETEASYAVGAVMRVVRRHVSGGEIEDVVAVLPPDVRPLLGG
jgi:uncharacterized protein (DUF2267 family)